MRPEESQEVAVELNEDGVDVNLGQISINQREMIVTTVKYGIVLYFDSDRQSVE